DVRSIDIGVGHDDDAVVAELLEVLFDPYAAAQCRDECGDLLGLKHLVEAGALDVQDLSAKGKDRLELALPALLGGTTGGLALDDVDLAELGVLFLAVAELARKRGEL